MVTPLPPLPTGPSLGGNLTLMPTHFSCQRSNWGKLYFDKDDYDINDGDGDDDDDDGGDDDDISSGTHLGEGVAEPVLTFLLA